MSCVQLTNLIQEAKVLAEHAHLVPQHIIDKEEEEHDEVMFRTNRGADNKL